MLAIILAFAYLGLFLGLVATTALAALSSRQSRLTKYAGLLFAASIVAGSLCSIGLKLSGFKSANPFILPALGQVASTATHALLVYLILVFVGKLISKFAPRARLLILWGTLIMFNIVELLRMGGFYDALGIKGVLMLVPWYYLAYGLLYDFLQSQVLLTAQGMDWSLIFYLVILLAITLLNNHHLNSKAKELDPNPTGQHI